MKQFRPLLAGLGALVAVSAAQAQQDPGLTDKSIKIGVFAPLSGNSMAYGFDVLNAARMYYDKVNKEGGVHGRKIELVIEDDRCSANDLLAAVKKLNEQDKVFALNGGSCSGAVVGAREYIERSQIPYVMLNASGDGALYPPSKYIYGAFSISQRAVGGSMVQFASEHLKGKKVGYINHDDAYGSWNLGDTPRSLPSLVSGDPVIIGDAVLTRLDVAIFGVAVIVMLLLYLMFNKTRIGKAMRAVGMNPKAAQIVGIRLSSIRMMVWALAGFISALAALLITPKILITPDIAHIAILAYAAAIVGGFTSLPGAVLGGFIIGVVENLVGLFISTNAIVVAPFLAILITLVVRPQGLLGGKLQVKKV